MLSFRAFDIFVFTIFILFPALAAAQPPLRQLAKPEAVLGQGFTEVAGIREISDGRSVLIDPREQRVLLLSSDLSDASPIGRVGQGPGEYIRPTRLFAIEGDSTAVLDVGNARLLIVDGEGRPAGFVDLGAGCVGTAPVRAATVQAADGLGHLYIRRTNPGKVNILRAVPEDCDAVWEIVAELPGTGGRQGAGGIVLGGDTRPPFSPTTEWAVGRDGRVAVVHPDPFRVVVRHGNGEIREGPVIAYEPVAVTESHRQQRLEEQERPVLMSMRTRGEAGLQHRYLPPPPLPESTSWPATLPPFMEDGAVFAPDGTLWLQRWVPVSQPPTFDLIDGDGRVVDRVQLPMGRRLVALGESTVYAVRRDDFDLEYVERYRLR